MGKLNWTPWMGMDDLRDKMDRLLEEAMHGPGAGALLMEKGYVWVPQADVLETPQAFVIRMDLSGLTIDNVSVDLDGGDLWITGDRPFAREENGVYQVLERSYGPFARKFVLTESADRESVAAVLKDGVLTVTIGKKRPASRTRRIVPGGE